MLALNLKISELETSVGHLNEENKTLKEEKELSQADNNGDHDA